ncbi:hypothetical protein P22_0669 [Propionispora sp. 2/2-37]|uniref:four-carbon acid sugar kinase family protein n=1 Tax=Propionispora sp. 2/2-37 TaxID=1677858 RepID=UPI0006BB64AD|nr:four-carbon acid sugar kinase family protein [Propionispora sp. 2/2-37]CUH94603.1 hypothetical protein P22_0669 [Propionispora sp. 2/2-37]
MTKLVVIADDITGANDTALQFAKRNVRSSVRIDFDQKKLLQETAAVLVIDTDSRDLAPEEAYRKVKATCEVLRTANVQHIYKKVDSTLRGNLGAEIEAAATVFQPELVAIAPAFPENRRVTVGGYQLVESMPLELTEFAYAPKSPVKESRIVELLQRQTDRKIGLVPLHTVMNGEQAIGQAIENCVKQGKKWVVFDAVLDKHLRSIAKAAKAYTHVLWVGSAGLAERLADFYQWAVEPRKETAALGKGTVLVIAGSVSRITQAQITAALQLPGTKLIKLDVAGLLRNNKLEIKRCIKQGRAFLLEGKDVVLASSGIDSDLLTMDRAAEKAGFNHTEVSGLIAAALGDIANQLADCRLAGMVLTGGDTAIHVCRSLGAEAIEIVEEVAVGIPLGRLVGGCCDGLPVITKAGAFGSEDSFVLALQKLRSAGDGQYEQAAVKGPGHEKTELFAGRSKS